MLGQKLTAIIGIMLVLVLYFWGHNVGESSVILRGGILTLTIALATLVSVWGLLGIAGGIGRWLLRGMDRDRLSMLEWLALDSLIGLGTISLLTATLGLIGQYTLLIWGILLVIALVLIRPTLSWFRDLWGLSFYSGRVATPWERFVRGFATVTLLSALLLALAPPFAWDAINYHLVVPAHYIEAGAIVQNLDNHFFGFPQNIEMLYGLLMMLGSDHAPAVMHLSLGLLGLIALYHFVERHTSSKAGALAVLVMLGSFNVWLLMGWAYVDLALMSYGIVSVISIMQWVQTDSIDPRWQWLMLTAISAGMAAGIKYTAAPLLIAIYVVIVLHQPKQLLRNTLIYGALGALMFAPWLVKGLLLYENPFYPYVFDGVNWDSMRSANFGETGKGLIDNGLWWHIPLLPFTATIFGVHRLTPYSFTAGAFLLTLPFLLPLGWSRLPQTARQLARVLLPMALVVMIFWMGLAAVSGIGGQTRLMLIGLPLVAMLGALAYHSLEKFLRRPLDIVFITQAALIISIVLGTFDYVSYFSRSRVLEYHSGAIDEHTYLTQNMGLLYPAMLALDDLPDGSRVLFLWEPKTYHCPDDLTCTGDLLFDNWSRPLQMGTTPDELIDTWRAEYDYALLFTFEQGESRDGYALWSQYHEFALEENALFPQYFYEATEPIWSDEIAYTLYRWR
ncbi:MAG: ArnT family glycosyltransferase [Anaerolineae bacterium]